MPEGTGDKQGDVHTDRDPGQPTPPSKRPSHLGSHSIKCHKSMRKVAKHEDAEQGSVGNFLCGRVMRKVPAGRVDDRDTDKRHCEEYYDKLE